MIKIQRMYLLLDLALNCQFKSLAQMCCKSPKIDVPTVDSNVSLLDQPSTQVHVVLRDSRKM